MTLAPVAGSEPRRLVSVGEVTLNTEAAEAAEVLAEIGAVETAHESGACRLAERKLASGGAMKHGKLLSLALRSALTRCEC